ncbi:phosphonate C-P lyase system protein PhnH [Rhizobium miluonense]|uniref:Alpha-D-ribose 1-methylphosphonate 5-triphosphate synthase subunit PhnH n=1 Tax=Rhizobium miluonense TaxID=411945 RepID=A0A1C3WDY5_9HYPH|nr:phosphonate C-P lyase system protein PhnH [Rhizobium miluonense]SCB38240.1 alpha-D-ribose 1-methylphosphonate 5-triphosphate synthase subunit PhnH [Rhizobium miluonense]
MSTEAIAAQFGNPTHDTQQAFRALLSASSRPGTLQYPPLPTSAPARFSLALCAIALTLFDETTSVWLDPELLSEEVVRYLRFHTGAPLVGEKSAASFAVIVTPSLLLDLAAFPSGDSAYPDRSATLVVQVPSLTGGPEVVLRGPGIEAAISISPAGLPEGFWQIWNENSNRYPCGIDLYLTDGTAVMALPRTTKASA